MRFRGTASRGQALLMELDARDALVASLESVGLSVALPGADSMRADLIVVTPDSSVELSSLELEIMATTIVTAEDVSRIVHWRGEGVIPILVADEVPAPMRTELHEHGISWLDRRGHLRLTAPGIFVDADVPATA
jgi:hypothetical protein